MTSKKVLIVDDESTVLELYLLELGSQFDVEIAESGQQAIDLFDAGNQYAVVVSDMHMPGMNGAELLNIVQQRCPLTTRIMLTGDDQQEVAIKAVNEGQIFRFLSKPCTAKTLASALNAGLEQNRLRGAEKELLEQTLRGSVSLLVDMLTVVQPLAFGRSSRVKRLVDRVCEHTKIGNSWELRLAAMLSQIGCVSLPDDVVQSFHDGGVLKAIDQIEFNKHPDFGARLLGKIPRLERISRVIAAQFKLFEDLPRRMEDETEIQHAAILAVALEFDRLTMTNMSVNDAIDTLRRAPKRYSGEIVAMFDELFAEQMQSRELKLSELRVGMLLEDDIKDDRGAMLVTRGQEISELLLERLLRRADSITQPIHVSEVCEKVTPPVPQAAATNVISDQVVAG